ncbi:MAG TPA: hypothetical protein VKA07_00455 [Candidatus Sulfotelmatobacter sp.]|nr:hypothetical protein [Candidatus Sulfotelmatobacter sp.]
MATAKQQPTTKFAVTLLIEGSKLETVAKKIKEAVGDVKVIGDIEKIVVPGTGEWGTEWIKHEGYMNTVLVNTDGRIIQRFEVENEDGSAYMPDTYTYRTNTAQGKRIADRDTLEEAKATVPYQMTQAELMETADEVAAHVVKYGAGDHEESGLIEMSAERWLIGRNKDIPKQEFEEDNDKRRTPEYIVTLRIKASTLPAVEKKAKAAFGDRLKSVEKVSRGMSRAAEFAEAEEHLETVKEIVGGLREDMENWRDNTPDSLQGEQKYSEVEECASRLESLEDELNGIDWDVEFPGMF